jgi:hypothetical protein
MNIKMTFRRKLMSLGLGLLLSGFLLPKKAMADNPAEKLFKKALNYIAQIILQYYGKTWYENTKKQMEEFSDYNQENTIEQKNKMRENLARLGDSSNAVQKSQYEKELQIETAPSVYPCGNEQMVSIDRNVDAARKATINTSGISTIDSSNENASASVISSAPYQFDSPKAKSRFDYELLTESFGYRNNDESHQYEIAMSCVEKLMGPEPMYQSAGIMDVDSSTDRYHNLILNNIAMRNMVRNSLHSLIAKRKKSPLLQQYPSDMDSIVENYNVSEGVSFLETLAIQVDMYSTGSDFMTKVNEYAGLTPLTIVLAEMKALENKLLMEISSAQETIRRIESIDVLASASSKR